MFWLISRLRHDLAAWDRAARLAFLLSLILLIAAVILILIAPPDARLAILVGAAALLIVLEVTVLWGNRGMVSAYTRAQRLYMDGELEAARDLLEAAQQKAELAHKKSDASTLTLLGNVYRQLGRLRESEAVLSEAVDKAPNRYFSFYGFGRTLLSEGRYADAAAALARSLELGAPPGVRVDLAEAYYRLNQPQDALAALGDAAPSEPHRALMASYLRQRLSEAPPPAPELVREGLPYWQATAERFLETPYGEALMLDVREMLKQGT